MGYEAVSGRIRAAARWLNRDPLGEKGGLNLYGYVGNNPISRIDPFGLVWYDPTSWNWHQIGSAFELNGGGGPAIGADIHLGPIDIQAKADVIMFGGYVDLGGDMGNLQGASANLDIKVGPFAAGYMNKSETRAGTDRCGNSTFSQTPSNPGDGHWVFGKVEGDSSNPYQLGVTGDIGIGQVTAQVDFKKIWQGITQ